MNVCLVYKNYLSNNTGDGIRTYILNLTEGLVNLGHNVHVITSGNNSINKPNNIIVHELKYPSSIFTNIFPESIIHSYNVAIKLNDLINDKQIDIVEFPNWLAEGFYFSSFCNKKIPIITRLHTTHFQSCSTENRRFKLRDRFMCNIEKTALQKSNLLTSSTHYHKSFVSKIYKLDSNKITVVPLGINLYFNNLTTSDIKRENYFNILFVGRLQKRKGIYTVLNVIPEILNKFDNVRFIIVGLDCNNSVRNTFLQQCKSNPDIIHRVQFPGHVSDQELERYYRDCDIFLAPSLYESFGLVYLEAMKYGKAVIGCKSGGVPEVVTDGKTGILIAPDSSKELASAITILISNARLRLEMGRNGLENFKNKFSVGKMTSETINTYKYAIEKFKFE